MDFRGEEQIINFQEAANNVLTDQFNLPTFQRNTIATDFRYGQSYV